MMAMKKTPHACQFCIPKLDVYVDDIEHVTNTCLLTTMIKTKENPCV